ncbi:unnamed protein product [Bursaphelenchus okinawaensis]|uniref:Uncharacterized protein n=1 Tax=Bursaphelenchus okinawaensis TaxID=465554 RepID=A0A811K4X1_9BILA|nr:unnamed protein product [Bursaphelenchus okinawaensis]CAG9092568.1 unnamed protein product [Bursaphelenchus okinawaensis]
MDFTLLFIATLTVVANADLQGISTQEENIANFCDWPSFQNTSLCVGLYGPQFSGTLEPICDFDNGCLVTKIDWEKVAWIVFPLSVVVLNVLAWLLIYLRFMRRSNVSIEEFAKTILV